MVRMVNRKDLYHIDSTENCDSYIHNNLIYIYIYENSCERHDARCISQADELDFVHRTGHWDHPGGSPK